MLRPPFVCSLLIGLIISLAFRAANPAIVNAATIHHYEYVFIAGTIYVYDMDNGHTLLKTVSVPTNAGVRGAVASVATGMLYISYGSDGNSGGFQLAYDLSTDRVVWTMSYGHGIDSQSVSPDGKKIYMPSGEASSGGTWYVEDSSNGNDITTILSGGSGPHNTIVSPSGNRVYLGNRDSASSTIGNDFDIADTSTNLIIGRVAPLLSGARPFTTNSSETLAFITASGFIGFQVGDLAAGKVIYTVPVDGSKIPGFTTSSAVTGPSHGISLSPDNKEIYVVDQPNSYVHVFDVSGLPSSAPVQVADIKLLNPFSGSEAGCVYDCLREGWLQHSRDGRFVYVGDSGDVIDTRTRKTIATLPALANSRIHIEIDFQDSSPIWAATSRSGIGYASPQPPTFTARITSPDLGSTVSGTHVTVSASVFANATISGVDLYKDGILYASTTASPYAFAWDTTKDANGPHKLMVTAHDTAGDSTSFSATFNVSNANNTNPPSITTTSLPNGTQNAAYSATLAATGGATPYSWSVVSGALPSGLALGRTTGVISGTPTRTGTSNFNVQVTDGNSLTAATSLSLTVTAVASPSITTTSLPNGAPNSAYNATLAATGGATPYSWSLVSNALPAGLALGRRTGVISGTPTRTGTSNFTIQVTDANSLTATRPLSLTVSASSSISITTSSLPNGTQNSAYNATLAATRGATPYTWSIFSGALPTGLTLGSNTGAISGTPTGTGTSNFTVRVTDANSFTATKALNLTINTNGGSGGGIGLVQSNAIQGSGVASVSVAFPTSNTAGNLIIAFVRMSSTGQSVAVTDSVGNAYTSAVSQAQSSDGHQVHIFYASNLVGGANTVKATFSATNNHPWLAIYEYRGLSTTNPLDQTASAQGSGASPNTGATATTVSANELLFAATGLPSSYSGTVTAGSGYTMLQQDTNTSLADNEGVVVTSTGAYAATFGTSSGTNWTAVLATFRP
jgi:hypothetical protein